MCSSDLVRVCGNGHAHIAAGGGVLIGTATLESDLIVSI